MRFKLEFRVQSTDSHLLPVHHHSEIAAWIHKCLHFNHSGFIEYLKDKAYLNNKGEYKLFTYSDMDFDEFKQHDDRILLESENSEMTLSFFSDDDIEGFIYDIFDGMEFKIGDSKSKVAFKVVGVKKIETPDFSKGEAMFSCISPMLISDEVNGSPITFLSPDHKLFERAFFKSLMSRYALLVKYSSDKQNALSDLSNLSFKLLNKPKSKIIKIKAGTTHPVGLKGYLFDFHVKAPSILLSIGYQAGFGFNNELGFGCCEIKTK